MRIHLGRYVIAVVVRGFGWPDVGSGTKSGLSEGSYPVADPAQHGVVSKEIPFDQTRDLVLQVAWHWLVFV